MMWKNHTATTQQTGKGATGDALSSPQQRHGRKEVAIQQNAPGHGILPPYMMLGKPFTPPTGHAMRWTGQQHVLTRQSTRGTSGGPTRTPMKGGGGLVGNVGAGNGGSVDLSELGPHYSAPPLHEETGDFSATSPYHLMGPRTSSIATISTNPSSEPLTSMISNAPQNYYQHSYFGDMESLGGMEDARLEQGHSQEQLRLPPALSQSVAGGKHKLFKPYSPLNAEDARTFYPNLLTLYEQREIYEFPEIYYLGSPSAPKINGPLRKSGADLSASANIPSSDGGASPAAGEDKVLYNHGFDDHRGDYYLTKHDHIAYRYEMLSMLGKGSFGVVVKCWDHKKGCVVALKMIRNKKRFEKQGTIEVKVLKRLVENDPDDAHSVIHVLDTFHFRHHLCLTFQLLGINLYEWLKAGSFKGVHLGIVKSISNQLLSALSLLKRLSIVHADLKPENILLADAIMQTPSRFDADHGQFPYPGEFQPNDKKYAVRVIDLGSSCLEEERIYTYVQSRFYRSPEVILGIPYNCAIDMWSFGCILAELYTGYPIFPGENETEQLACIMEIRGLPPPDLLQKASRRKLFFDTDGKPKLVPNSKGRKRTPGYKSLGTAIRCKDGVFLDFLDKCLDWNPQTRLTPQEALQHEFMQCWPRKAHEVLAGGHAHTIIVAKNGHVAITPNKPGRAMAGAAYRQETTAQDYPAQMGATGVDGKRGGFIRPAQASIVFEHQLPEPNPHPSQKMTTRHMIATDAAAKKSPLARANHYTTGNRKEAPMQLLPMPQAPPPVAAHTRHPRTHRLGGMSGGVGHEMQRSSILAHPTQYHPSQEYHGKGGHGSAAIATILPPIYGGGGNTGTQVEQGRRATISTADLPLLGGGGLQALATTGYAYFGGGAGQGTYTPVQGLIPTQGTRKGPAEWMGSYSNTTSTPPVAPVNTCGGGHATMHRHNWRM